MKIIINLITTNGAFNNNYIQYESMRSKDKDKNLSIKEYIDVIRPYLSDIINNHKTQEKRRIHSSNTMTKYKTQGEWKIHLTMAINFISSKEDYETRTMRTQSDNIEITMGSETDEITKELFKYILQRYQEGLEESMKESEPIFDSVDVLYYDLNKASLNRGGSYIDSLEWLKNKKARINPKNNDDKSFQYALTVVLNYEKIKTHTESISKIKPFFDRYNWKEISFPLHKKDWKKFELNNKSIDLNILYIPYNNNEIRHAYKSKHNLKRENQIILLMITDGKKWYYLAVKSLSALLRGIKSKYEGDFYCLNFVYLFRTKNKLKKQQNICENHDYCYVEMPKKDNKMLKYNHGEKSMKVPFTIYADLESLVEKNEHLS